MTTLEESSCNAGTRSPFAGGGFGLVGVVGQGIVAGAGRLAAPAENDALRRVVHGTALHTAVATTQKQDKTEQAHVLRQKQ